MWYNDIKPFCFKATEGHRERIENRRAFEKSSAALIFLCGSPWPVLLKF
jgi:hypothetical protein